MNIVQWKPLKEIDNFFDNQFSVPFFKADSDLSVDVYQEDGDIIAKMSLPGVQFEKIEVSIEDNLLTVSGQRKEEKETDKKDYYSKEIRRGSFYRTVQLPVEVDVAKAEAHCKDGLLTFKAPVLADTQKKAVKIKVTE